MSLEDTKSNSCHLTDTSYTYSSYFDKTKIL